jgi:hypothetical protein
MPNTPTPVRSYAPQIMTHGDDPWVGNHLRFETEIEAANNVRDLAAQWSEVMATRVVPAADSVNYRYLNGELLRLINRQPVSTPRSPVRGAKRHPAFTTY